jgi:DNA-binding NtrC family response regulator
MKDVSVLIIDDDDELRFNLTLFLEDEGFYCVSACSAEEAFEIVETRNFDITIVDLRLPGKNGEEFISNIAPLNKIKKFIIHTGSLDYQATTSLQNLGVSNSNILFKPLNDMNELVVKINEIINS